MTAEQDTRDVQRALERAGIAATFEDAQTLRRAQITLHRWAELECGGGNDWASWTIERDEETDKPFMCVYPHSGKNYRRPIADREAGALRRVVAVCERLGVYFYHQSDPRENALRIHTEPMTDGNYTRGVCV